MTSAPTEANHVAARVKQEHPLLAFLAARGLSFTRGAHGTMKARCPFHTEKTSSFTVYADHHYHCYGCGAHGDIFTYLEHTEGLDFKAAIAQLSGRGLEALLTVRKHHPAPAAAPAPEAPLHVLTERQAESWGMSCQRLLQPEHLQHWSEWRGIHADLLADCARHGLLGVHPYQGQMREGFLIQAPAAAFPHLNTPAGHLLPHSVHVRLAPGSVGNDSKSPSWRYDPPSGRNCRTVSFPFLLSKTQTHMMHSTFHVEQPQPSYSYLLFTEGQWDALALADALGWHCLADIPAHTCIIGLRGATSWRRYLEFCLPRPDHAISRALPAALCFGDADRAGAQWFSPGGFLEQLKEVTRLTRAFRPCIEGQKDLNDLWKAGLLDTTKLRSLLRRALGAPPATSSPQTQPITFLRFLRSQRSNPALTSAITHVLADPHKPATGRPAHLWTSYLRSTPDGDTLISLWNQWLHPASGPV